VSSYIRLSTGILIDPKTRNLPGGVLASFIKLLLWSQMTLADGVIPLSVALEYSSTKTIKRLLKVGLIRGQSCGCLESCLPVSCKLHASLSQVGRKLRASLLQVDCNIVVVNYLKHNDSKAKIKEKSEKLKARVTRYREDRNADVTRLSVSTASTVNSLKENALRASKKVDVVKHPTHVVKQHTADADVPKRGKTICPVDWQPRQADVDKAIAAGVDPVLIRDEMVDWSHADSNRNRKTDWDATFRQWVRKRHSEQKVREQYTKSRQKLYQVTDDEDSRRRELRKLQERQAEEAMIAKRYEGIL
jgi:hypothetical protein